MNQFRTHINENWYEPYLIAAAVFISVYFRLWGPAPGDIVSGLMSGNEYVQTMWLLK